MAWTDQRYDLYVQSRWMPVYGGVEQMSNLHKITVVKGQFTDTLYIVDDGPTGDAFIKSGQGSIKFTQGLVRWNPATRKILNKAVQHISTHQSN